MHTADKRESTFHTNTPEVQFQPSGTSRFLSTMPPDNMQPKIEREDRKRYRLGKRKTKTGVNGREVEGHRDTCSDVLQEPVWKKRRILCWNFKLGSDP